MISSASHQIINLEKPSRSFQNQSARHNYKSTAAMSPQRQYGLAAGEESQKSLNMLSSLSKYKRTQAPVATITCYST